MKIFVVEGNSALHPAWEHVFLPLRAEVVFCVDAVMLQHACLHEEIALILLDMDCMEIDAIQVCQAIRALPEGAFPVIIMTTFQEVPERLRTALDAGADDYLLKTSDEKILALRVAPIVCRLSHRIEYKELQASSKGALDIHSLKQILQREVTRRRQAERALRQVEKTIETMQLGVTITDVDGKITYTNPADARMHGYTVEELIGQDASLFAPQELRKKMSLEQIESMKDWVRKSINIRKDGSKFPVYLRSDVVKDDTGKTIAIVTTCEDITERTQAKETLEEERNLLRTLIDNLPDFIFVKDPDGRFLLNNVAHVHILGAETQDEVLGSTDFDIFPPHLAVQYVRDDQQVLSTGTPLIDREEITVSPEGETLSLLTTKVPLRDKEGHILGLVGISRNITESKQLASTLEQERKLLAQRVEERTAELSRANAELARASVLKDEFLANMSHELRTPLNVILGMSEAIQDEVYGALNERQHQALHSIEESGRHLLSLINDILDLSKIGAGKIELELTPVSVKSLCNMSVRFIKQDLEKKRLKFSTTLDEQVETLYADERRVIQMLVNLLSNAVKFTPEGGEISLTVQGDVEQDMLHFQIVDTGIGIAQTDMERLFQPFVQLDSKLSRKYPGTGLGLSLVYRMVELHGGSISVNSEPGKGSCFTLSLPWKQQELLQEEALETGQGLSARQASDAPPTTVSGELPLKASQSAPLVLIAEDNEANIETLDEYLKIKGYRTLIARNGKEAIERARERLPDIILMDIHMPEIDGLEAIRQLRNDNAFHAIPIVAVTALTMPGDREKCLASGADAYISKPLHLKKLIDLMTQLLSSKSGASQRGTM